MTKFTFINNSEIMEDTLNPEQSFYSILFDNHAAFKEVGVKDISPWLDSKGKNLPKLFENYEYPVCSWPVVINSQTSNSLRRLSVRLPELINQIPELFFKKDLKKIADFYFGGNEMLSQFAMLCYEKNIEVSCRLDLTFTNEGFKVLEANVGSSIGGWQIQSFEPIIRELHPFLSNPASNNNWQSRNTQQIYISFLVEKVLQNCSSVKEEINVFINLGDLESELVEKESIIFFNNLLSQELGTRGMVGNVYSGDISSLRLVDGQLRLGEKNIHSVLILNVGKDDAIPPDIFRAFMMGKLYFPDHLGVSLLGDKRNLALLRELAMNNEFNHDDNKLILESIPWTKIVRNGKVKFKEQEYELLQLLRKKKDSFVIKTANGFQGNDVFVGRFCSDEEWEDALNLSIQKGNFIAQEFCDSLDFFAPNRSNEWVAHKLIWGAFSFGKEYGGVWVRMSATQTDVGIINSAKGAVEAIVYEPLL